MAPLPPTLSTIKIVLPSGGIRLICRSPVAVCSNRSSLTLKSAMIIPGSGMTKTESTSPGTEIGLADVASGIALGTSTLAKREHPAGGVALGTTVDVAVFVAVDVGELVTVGVRVTVGVCVGVLVDLAVMVGVRVAAGVRVAVGVEVAV